MDQRSPMEKATFEIDEDRAGECRWRLLHVNGNIIADSGEGYASRQKCEKVSRASNETPRTPPSSSSRPRAVANRDEVQQSSMSRAGLGHRLEVRCVVGLSELDEARHDRADG